MWKNLALLLLVPNLSWAITEPQATFRIEDGFIQVAVTRDGSTPVHAKVIVTANGGPWAEGETDDQGLCEFPKPSTPTCEIAFDIEGTATPPVLLTFVDDGKNVVPLVAPLVPGPCCKTPKLVSDEINIRERSVSVTDWRLWLTSSLAGLVFFCLSYCCLRYLRTR